MSGGRPGCSGARRVLGPARPGRISPTRRPEEHAKLLAQRLLAEPIGLLNHTQDPNMRWLQAEGFEAPGKPGGGIRANLRQKEGEPVGRVRRAGSRARAGNSFFSKIVIPAITIDHFIIIPVGFDRGKSAPSVLRPFLEREGDGPVRLNHANLTVPDVARSREFFETYFGLRCVTEKGRNALAVLVDETGFVLTLEPKFRARWLTSNIPGPSTSASCRTAGSGWMRSSSSSRPAASTLGRPGNSTEPGRSIWMRQEGSRWRSGTSTR